VIGGVEQKIHFFAMDLPHSDAGFVQAYPAETTEAFCAGHTAAFGFFGKVPKSILYDNTKIAVARILGDGKRLRTRVFSELQSHYLFLDRFGRPGKGNDKGKVEGLVGLIRRNYLVPRAPSYEALNAKLIDDCRGRFGDRLRGHAETICERLVRDLAVFQALPATPYDACEKKTGRVSSLSLVRYRETDYSVPTAYGHREVLIHGYVHEAVIACGADIIARHTRSYEREDFVFDPLHYLALLEQKIGALDQAAPLVGGICPKSSPCSVGSWKRAWASAANGSSSRSCDCWRSSAATTWWAGSRKRWPGVRSASGGQAPGAMPDRAPAAQARPVGLSLSSAGDRGDDVGQDLHGSSHRGGVMTDTPQLLLAHHLKALKLPTFLREYDKLAQQCAAEGVDHTRYLLRLAELELIERERRTVERRIKEARFPAVKSLDSFDFLASMFVSARPNHGSPLTSTDFCNKIGTFAKYCHVRCAAALGA
jgi:hypothetical protein